MPFPWRSPVPRTAILAILSVLAIASPAQAQIGAEISPANAHVSAAPGTTLNGSLSVKNPTDVPISLAVGPSDFVLEPNNGIVPLPVGSLSTSMAPWMTVSSSSVNLQPGASTMLRYTISVPSTAKPGSHWGMILFQANTGPASGSSGNAVGMGVGVQVAFVIYVDIGTLNPDGRVTDITLSGGAGMNPQVATVTFQNTGDAYMRLQGRLEIRTTKGSLVGTYQLPVKASLPTGVTALEVTLDPKLGAGDYLATAILDYGSPARIAGQAELHVP